MRRQRACRKTKHLNQADAAKKPGIARWMVVVIEGDKSGGIMADWRKGHICRFGVYLPKAHRPVLLAYRNKQFPVMSDSAFLGHLIELGAKVLKIKLPGVKR